MAEKDKKPVPPPSSSDDLIPRSMLPDKSVIPEWRQFGYGAEPPKDKPKVKKKARGGGIEIRGKTRGRFV